MSEKENVTVEESESIEIIPDTETANDIVHYGLQQLSLDMGSFATSATLAANSINSGYISGSQTYTGCTTMPMFNPIQDSYGYGDVRKNLPSVCRCGESMLCYQENHLFISGGWYCSKKCFAEKLVRDLAMVGIVED